MKFRISNYKKYQTEPYLSAIMKLYGLENVFNPIELIYHIYKNDYYKVVNELIALDREMPIIMREEIINEIFFIMEETKDIKTIQQILIFFPEAQIEKHFCTLMYYCRDMRLIVDTFCKCFILHNDNSILYFLMEDIINRDLIKLITHVKNDLARNEFICMLKNNNPLPGHIYQLMINNEDLMNYDLYEYFMSLKPKESLIKLLNSQYLKNNIL